MSVRTDWLPSTESIKHQIKLTWGSVTRLHFLKGTAVLVAGLALGYFGFCFAEPVMGFAIGYLGARFAIKWILPYTGERLNNWAQQARNFSYEWLSVRIVPAGFGLLICKLIPIAGFGLGLLSGVFAGLAADHKQYASRFS